MFNDVAYECSFVFGNGFLQLVKHQMIDSLQLRPCTLPPSNNTINAIHTCTLPPSNTHCQPLDTPQSEGTANTLRLICVSVDCKTYRRVLFNQYKTQPMRSVFTAATAAQ